MLAPAVVSTATILIKVTPAVALDGTVNENVLTVPATAEVVFVSAYNFSFVSNDPLLFTSTNIAYPVV